MSETEVLERPVLERPRPVQRSPEPQAAVRVAREWLLFRLAGEEYGIDIQAVQEIRRYEPATRLSGAPRSVKGIVNLRGTIVPVVDLRINLGLDSTAYDDFTVTIVVNVCGRTVGVIVDSVSDVIQLAEDQIRPAPSLSRAGGADFVVGVGVVEASEAARLLILTDVDAMLAGVGPLELHDGQFENTQPTAAARV